MSEETNQEEAKAAAKSHVVDSPDPRQLVISRGHWMDTRRSPPKGRSTLTSQVRGLIRRRPKGVPLKLWLRGQHGLTKKVGRWVSKP